MYETLLLCVLMQNIDVANLQTTMLAMFHPLTSNLMRLSMLNLAPNTMPIRLVCILLSRIVYITLIGHTQSPMIVAKFYEIELTRYS